MLQTECGNIIRMLVEDHTVEINMFTFCEELAEVIHAANLGVRRSLMEELADVMINIDVVKQTLGIGELPAEGEPVDGRKSSCTRQLISECSKTIQAVSKRMRRKPDDGLAAQMGRLVTCIENVKRHYQISDEDIEQGYRAKCERYLKRKANGDYL